MNPKLIRAIWECGFRLGKRSGHDSAMAYEHGTESRSPETPNEVWFHEIQWRIETNCGHCKLNLDNPDDWDFI